MKITTTPEEHTTKQQRGHGRMGEEESQNRRHEKVPCELCEKSGDKKKKEKERGKGRLTSMDFNWKIQPLQSLPLQLKVL